MCYTDRIRSSTRNVFSQQISAQKASDGSLWDKKNPTAKIKSADKQFVFFLLAACKVI